MEGDPPRYTPIVTIAEIGSCDYLNGIPHMFHIVVFSPRKPPWGRRSECNASKVTLCL
jgi:hypothetical protein